MRPLTIALLVATLSVHLAAQSAPDGAVQHPSAPISYPDRYAGRPIEDLGVLIENRPSSDASLLSLIEMRVGQPLSMTAVRESITHLYSLGRFQDVQVDATDTPGGGVRVQFNLIPLHAVERVEFTGSLGISKGLLRRTVVDRYGATPPLGRAPDVASTLLQLYHDRGYLEARIRPVPRELHDPDRTFLSFEIEAGPQARIRDVAINGDPKAPREAFLRRLGATSGAAYQPSELQQRLTEYVQHLRHRGFYEATASQRAAVSGDNTEADLIIDVQPGPSVTVAYDGDRMPAERLDELVPIRREGSVDEDLIEDSERRIEAYLNQQGFWKAEVSSRRHEGNGTLTIRFAIHRGRQYRVADGIDISGNSAVSIEELRPLIGLKPGDPYVESQLNAAVGAVRELYRQRGFAGVSITSAANEVDVGKADEGRIKPALAIVEGPRTLLGAIRITGNSALSEGELRAEIRSREGDAFYQPRAAADREALRLAYLNNGFASADVTVDVSLPPGSPRDRAVADLTFRIQEGPQTLVDHVLIVGNTHTAPQIILREILLKPGEPLGLEALIESQRRLSALGLFRRVRITELRHGSDTRQDVLIAVDEAPSTTIGYGGGVEASQRLRAIGPGGEARERLEFAPRGFFDIGRRNLGGRNRTVDLYTRISLRPRDAPDDPERDGSGFGFSEYRIVGTYREPRAFASSDITVTAAVEQGIRSSFNFSRRGLNADVVHRLTPAIRASGRYSFNTTRTFDERLSEEDQATIDRLFPQVRLSLFSGAIARDTRDDVLDPERGTFLSGEGSIAARSLGGQVGFVKSYLQGYWFRRLPGRRRRIVFATRAAAGLADGFPRESPVPGASVLIEDLPASERFFAGGDTTIRGFALDTVGTPATISDKGFPRGGNSVVILNGELRIAVWREVGAAVFMDGGNVFERVTDFDIGELRGAAGFGVRYRSPLGPIRVDLGFKMDRREIGGHLEPRTALHFSIGQAF